MLQRQPWRATSRALTLCISVFSTCLLLASCGGGGGSAGTCMGSQSVCSGGSGGGGSGNAGGGNPGGGDAGNNGGNEAQVVLSGDVPAYSVAGQCTEATQRQFVRSYLNEVYLWADEIPAVNSVRYSVPDYFNALRVTTPDSQGYPKDRFSFMVSTADADSQSTGAAFDYGIVWVRDAQERLRVARLVPGSPAESAGMARGGEMVGVTASTHDSWYPNVPGAQISFLYRDAPGGATRSITLNTAAVQDNPVSLATVLASPGGRRVGYVAFHDHAEGAQDKLIAAMQTLAASNVQELVLDLRYNRGGYLYIAHTLASMVTGPASDGRVFERMQFHAKRNMPPEDTTFRFAPRVLYGERQFPADTALPRLDLRRVYVLSTEDTCSASESVVNGLRGVDIDVVLVGSTTCGKPYGFTRRDNCSFALFPIEFQGVNDKNFGDYTTGMAPNCAASDDLGRALGDPAEGMLGVALRHADTGVCTGATLARVTRAQAPESGLPLRLRTPHPGRVAGQPRQ